MYRRRTRRGSDPGTVIGDAVGVAVGGAVGQLSRTQAGRRALAALVVVLLLALVANWAWDRYLRPRHPVGPAVRIATWNLRQFSERRDADLGAIAEVIRASAFDVIAIQEVKHDGRAVDALLNVLGSPWRATSLSGVTGNHERFVFLYDGDHVQEVRGTGGAHFVSSSLAPVFARTPYQATFRAGQFDFTLVTVHLSWDDRERRRREDEALASLAADVAASSAEKDVIVLGDFNAESPRDLGPVVSAGWQALNKEPTNLGSSRAYDTLLIDPRHTREWDGHAGAVSFDDIIPRYHDDAEARRRVSDHRPAYADFVTNLPDDD
jgi:endonuclease/exonuclease/phosphatase family metal-dependent hydrolase